MATYYVSTTASGGGVGTSGDPFTLDEGRSNFTATDTLYIKADGTYTMTSSLTFANSTNSGSGRIESYTTTVGDQGRATIDTAGYTFTFGAYNYLLYFNFTDSASSGTNHALVAGGEDSMAVEVTATSCANNSGNILTADTCIRCAAIGSGTNYGRGITATNLAAHCYAEAFDIGVQSLAHYRNIAYNGQVVISSPSYGSYAQCLNTISYGSAGDGFLLGSVVAGGSAMIADCIAYGAGAYSFDLTTPTIPVTIHNCAAGGHTSGRTNGAGSSIEINAITLTADPFTDAAGGDFSLNATAGGGALCRGAGLSPRMS